MKNFTLIDILDDVEYMSLFPTELYSRTGYGSYLFMGCPKTMSINSFDIFPEKKQKPIFFWVKDLRLYVTNNGNFKKDKSVRLYSDERLLLLRDIDRKFLDYLSGEWDLEGNGVRHLFEKDRYKVFNNKSKNVSTILFPYKTYISIAEWSK